MVLDQGPALGQRGSHCKESVRVLLAQGGLVALSLIFVDEIDKAYDDVHSASSMA